MSTPNIEILNIDKVQLGEGPHWNASKQTLYFVDVIGNSVRTYHPGTGQNTQVILGAEKSKNTGPSFVIPIENSENEFIVGCGQSLKKLTWDSTSDEEFTLNTVYDGVFSENPEGRFNDAKCDCAGRLWTGTVPPFNKDPALRALGRGIVYKLDTTGVVTKEFTGIDFSNGLDWSPDFKSFYLADTFKRTVDAYSYDATTGKICNQSTIFDFAKENEGGVPDGLTVDVNGNIWVTSIFDGQLLQIDPVVSKVVNRIRFPTALISSVAFGGANLDELYVTSMNYILSPELLHTEPHAGATFKVTNIGTRGMSAGRNHTASSN